MSQPINLDDQLSNARALSNSVQFSLSQNPHWHMVEAAGQCEVACNLIDGALRRLIAVEIVRVPDTQYARFSGGMAALLGEHIGRILSSLPSDVVETALNASIKSMLDALGADPAHTVFNVSIADHQKKEPLH